MLLSQMLIEIQNFLSQKCIAVPDEWIPACVDFIRNEHNFKNVPVSDLSWLKNKVYEQWLHSDLTELATSCVPFGLSRQKLSTIAGQFPLQVNYVKDVGLPAYSQLQKLRKDDIQNSTVSADQPLTAAWEPKPSRMLILQLTDGTSIIQGMEYSFIPSLSLGMKPGTKVLVKGSIECRRGIMLLTKDNITVLGGEVDSLGVPNAQENVLHRALGIDETDEPVPVSEAFLEMNHTFGSDTSSQYTQSRNHQSTQSAITFPFKMENNNDVLHCGTNNKRKREKESIEEEFDNFEEFFDDEALLAVQEAERNAVINSTNSSLNSQSYHPVLEKDTQQTAHTHGVGLPRDFNYSALNANDNFSSFAISANQNFKTNKKSATDDPFEVNDEDLLLAADFPSATALVQPNIFFKSSAKASTSGSFLQRQDNSCNKSAEPKLKNVTSSLKESEYNNYYGNKRFGPRAPGALKLESQDLNNSVVQQHHFEQSGRRLNVCSELEQTTTSAMNSSGPFQNSSGNRMSFYTAPCAEFSGALSHTLARPHSSRNFDLTADEKMFMRKIQTLPPFQYICNLDFTCKEKVTYTIKGFFVTLLSKLEQADGKWCLTAKINDGTGFCDTDIDDQVLRRLIGMDVSEYESTKAAAKLDPTLQHSVTQNIIKCQKELITLCCLLKLEVGNHFRRPRVSELIPLTQSHFHSLKTRALS